MKKGVKKGSKRGYEGSFKHTLQVDGVEVGEYEAKINKVNHLRQGKIYNDFCILNQEFLRYIISINLSKNEYNILMFLLSYMDKDNKIIIDSQMIEHHLSINSSNVNKYIKKLEDSKVIYKRNLGYKKGQEVLLNFDIISPHMAFKNPNKNEHVVDHKRLMESNERPYIRQINAFTNEIDFINPGTGEVFHTSPKIK
jgi:hypothetical protein